jgi:hypothetical protein
VQTSERLLPRWWVLVVVAIPVTMLAVAYGSAYGNGVGLAVGLIGGVIAGWLLWISAPVITMDAEFLCAGSARLPTASIGGAELVDRAQIRALRGPGSDARVFVVLRPWSARDGVLVNLDDELDPHPAWLLSSRHPQRLLDAIAAAGR